MALAAGLLAAGITAVTPAAATPSVRQLVAFRDGSAVERSGVSTRQVLVRVGGRRCAAADGTALAALVRSRPGSLRLRDFAACSRRPRDGAGLFVQSIRSDRNRGQNGWVYKVGRRGATAGAADPAGPFGRGRLKQGQRVTWFYCRLAGSEGCQRTLELSAVTVVPGMLTATVRGYDDQGRGIAIGAATVSAGAATGLTGPDGRVTLSLSAGSHRVVARRDGLVRSFSERVTVP